MRKINMEEVDYIVFYEKPFLKFEKFETYISLLQKVLIILKLHCRLD